MPSPFQELFPNFARLLETSGIADFHEIGDPATPDEILRLELSLGAPLPNSYKQFLRCVRNVSFGDAFKLDSDMLFFHERGLGEGMLCFADFWLEGDGDQALFDVSAGMTGGEYPVMYYNHDTPSVRKVADSFGEFIEHIVAKP